jgi:hypothetical protein
MGASTWVDKDYYAVLGVPSDATPTDIKQAFHALAKVHHPDVQTVSLDTETQFADVYEAYEVLSDPRLRAEYDESRAPATTPEVRTTSHGQQVRAPEPDLPLNLGEVEFHAARLNGRGWFAFIAVGVVVLAIVGVLSASWLWTTRALYAQRAAAVSADGRVGQTFYLDTGIGPSVGSAEATVQVESVTATAKLNAAGSGITTVPIRLVDCRPKPNVAPVDIVLADQVLSQCSSVRVVTPGDTLEVGSATGQLLYELPLTAQGDYVDLSVTLDYSQGRQAGEVTAESPAPWTKVHAGNGDGT